MTIEVKELVIQARVPDVELNARSTSSSSVPPSKAMEARWMERICQRVKEEVMEELRGRR